MHRLLASTLALTALTACGAADDFASETPEVVARSAQALVANVDQYYPLEGTVSPGYTGSEARLICIGPNCEMPTLLIRATGLQDTVTMTQVGANFVFFVRTVDPATGQQVANQWITCGDDTYPCGSDDNPVWFTGHVFLGGGDDTFTSSVATGWGSDDGSWYEGQIEVYGDGGDDTIDCANFAKGGPGNDTLIACGSAYLDGGDGDDVITGGVGTFNRLFGGAGDDTIEGGSGNDNIWGNAGADVISAFGGNDVIYGGDDGDTIYGGNGDDRIYGGAGRDTLYGDAGKDDISGNDGRDTMYGGSGKDTLKGGSARDTADGGPDSDSCSAESKSSC